MHIFIFPSKDTYITNFTNFENKNFGIDELLNISTVASSVKSVVKYQSGSLDSNDYILNNLVNFNGTVVGYFSGSTTNVIISDTSTNTSIVYGSVLAYANPTSSCADFVTTQFTGNVTGSVSGYVSSALLNGTTYTTQTVSLTHVSGSVTELSGSVSGSTVRGNVSGSLTGIVTVLSGSLHGISGTLEGDISGSYSYYNPKFSFNTYSKFSRALLKFDVSAISSSISSGDIVDPKFVLNMKVLKQQELPLTYTLYAYPVSQSWEMGNGRFADNGSTTGASWNYRDYSSTGGTRWYPSNPTKDLYDYLTNESNKSIAFGNGGGTWYYSVPNSATVSTSSFCSTLHTGSSLIASQSFGYESSDIKMDVTPIVKSWMCGCVPNEGFILLTSEELNTQNVSNGNLGFYGKETNTIYTPYVDVVYDDSTFVTGSLSPITDDTQLAVVLKNVKKEYKSNSVVRITVFAREKFPLKNFVKSTQQTAYLTPKYLPETSYYSIKDTETEEVIIDFDEGTKLSCDSNGNYFMLDMSCLPQERYFKILIKTELNGAVDVFDNNTYFKVVR
jgi:hypothetical protein